MPVKRPLIVVEHSDPHTMMDEPKVAAIVLSNPVQQQIRRAMERGSKEKKKHLHHWVPIPWR